MTKRISQLDWESSIDGRPSRREPEAELLSVEYGQAFVSEDHTIIDFK